MKPDELKKLLEEADFLDCGEKQLYRVYRIAKKGGGERTICEPVEELKNLQKKLIPFFKGFPCSGFAAAYETGCSIKNNALRHKNAKHILHADIKNFFPSISGAVFEKTFCKNLDRRATDRLWRAVSYQKGLPIGSPASPFIANRILFEADKKLGHTGLFIKYSRYADDLVFSSRKPIKEKLLDKIKKIVSSAGFSLNPKKTFFLSSRKEVTGIIVQNEKLSVGTGYKKRLKKEIYDYLVKKEGYPDIIRGKISHLKHIEPMYAEMLFVKYKKYDTGNFLDFIVRDKIRRKKARTI